jgi:hypothetical protein
VAISDKGEHAAEGNRSTRGDPQYSLLRPASTITGSRNVKRGRRWPSASIWWKEQRTRLAYDARRTARPVRRAAAAAERAEYQTVGAEGVVPVVFYRPFAGGFPDVVELAEDFRLFWDLYHDQRDLGVRWLAADDAGDAVIVAEQSPGSPADPQVVPVPVPSRAAAAPERAVQHAPGA